MIVMSAISMATFYAWSINSGCKMNFIPIANVEKNTITR